MAHYNLDSLDKKILKLIAKDARIPFLEVARLCNVSGAAIHQRIQKLTNLGVLKGSQFIIDPEMLGYETCAYIGLYLQNPATFDDVVEELKKIPEVVECHYTTGGFDMFIKLYARNNHICLTSSTISCSRSDSHAPRRLSRSMLSSTDSCQSVNCLLRTKMMQKKCLKRANNTYCKTNRRITKKLVAYPDKDVQRVFSLCPFTDLLLSCKEVTVILLHSRRRHTLGDAFRP